MAVTTGTEYPDSYCPGTASEVASNKTPELSCIVWNHTHSKVLRLRSDVGIKNERYKKM